VVGSVRVERSLVSLVAGQLSGSPKTGHAPDLPRSVISMHRHGALAGVDDGFEHAGQAYPSGEGRLARGDANR
jgi:hypothetical protein